MRLLRVVSHHKRHEGEENVDCREGKMVVDSRGCEMVEVKKQGQLLVLPTDNNE